MNKVIFGEEHYRCKATGELRLTDPCAFLDRVAAYCETYDIPVTAQRRRLEIVTDFGSIRMRTGANGLSIRLTASDEGALHMLRETVTFQVETLESGGHTSLEWHGTMAPGRMPPNFRAANVVSVTALGRSFWRLVVEGEDLSPFSQTGLHLRLALPTRGAPLRWPRLNEGGRTIWPASEDLHVAVYTIRDIDLPTGRMTIDIFRHAGGRTSTWMDSAIPGEAVGLIGPGGGWFPDADHLVIAGDETALPAISRILENAGDHVTGTVLVETDVAFEYPLPAVPPGMNLRVLDRADEDSLEAAIAAVDLGSVGGRHIWVAAEKGRAAAIRRDLRDRRGVGRGESYVTGYWQKT